MEQCSAESFSIIVLFFFKGDRAKGLTGREGRQAVY